MKHLLLISAALLVTFSVRAQTNTSVISQTGNGQSATAVQAGSYNESTIRQFTGSSTTVNVGNVASTNQTGSGSSLTNQASIDQINGAFSNTATVSQTLCGPAGSVPNIAITLQSENASRNVITITQEKSGNVSSVIQTDQSNDNEVTIRQLGTTGTAIVNQGTQSTNNHTTLTQTATSSGMVFGNVDQSSQSYYNRAILEQAGTGGAALITQSGESANNDAMIMQGTGGTNNLATIIQTNAYDGASAGGSTVLGAANSASISQNQTTASSTGNSAIITQGSFEPSPATGAVVVSTGNTASVAQENDANVSDLLQIGTGNTATITQNGNSTLKGVDGMTGINPTAGQFGDTNTLTVTQSGTLNNPSIGNVTQIGLGNFSTISQRAVTP